MNLLHNAPLESPLPLTKITNTNISHLHNTLIHQTNNTTHNHSLLQNTTIKRHHKLKQINSNLKTTNTTKNLTRTTFKPQLTLTIDTNIQGKKFSFTKNNHYILASLILRFNFFNNSTDRATLRQTHAHNNKLRTAHKQTEQSIRLKVLETVKDFEVAQASLRTAAKRVEAAAGAFEITRRKRDLGQVAPVEFIDARRALTSA
jgi:Outer membrane protein